MQLTSIAQAWLNYRQTNPTGGDEGAFTAGAAWMASEFAKGVGLIGTAPRKYKLSYYIGWSNAAPDAALTMELWAYSDEEAERALQAKLKWKSFRGIGNPDVPVFIESCNPAQISEEK